jgi:hypothetical protein
MSNIAYCMEQEGEGDLELRYIDRVDVPPSRYLDFIMSLKKRSKNTNEI